MDEKKNEVAVIPDAPHEATLFGTGNPDVILSKMTEVSQALANVIDKQRLWVNIQGKKYVLAEGWTTLGGLLNLSPCTVWTRRVPDYPEEAWEARVEVYQGTQLRGAAEAMCSRDEPRWKAQPSYAIRSMAQTRAMSKALRLPLGFVMKLAGYEATPAEEMDGVADTKPGKGWTPPQQRKATPDEPLYVNAVENYSPEGKNWTKYTITFSDGQEYSTFDPGIADLAKACIEHKCPVAFETEKNGKFLNLKSLTPLEKKSDASAPGEVENEDDLPF